MNYAAYIILIFILNVKNNIRSNQNFKFNITNKIEVKAITINKD